MRIGALDRLRMNCMHIFVGWLRGTQILFGGWERGAAGGGGGGLTQSWLAVQVILRIS